MSGGSPVGGLVRHRHFQGGYSSNGEDIEECDDDATSSRCHVFPATDAPSPLASAGLAWGEIVVNALWIASAGLVVYLGDSHCNLLFLLFHDERIRRVPLCLGMIAIMLNFLFFFYTITMAWRLRRFDEKWELTSISALPYITVLGLVAFILLAFSLWPIWSFLSIPLLFTIFMATMVVLPSIMISILKCKNDGVRAD
ncbi:hypothetical protein MLD38_014821 [Melastoma candidum]|uniref:Uncharacterized protein n=1 Tax=Melastoma candidum TaxID=119954 RepID=A0ACB9RF62_9MYRT|nr:hypothetical protein MLD38_014821 [Melastoma candidum]